MRARVSTTNGSYHRPVPWHLLNHVLLQLLVESERERGQGQEGVLCQKEGWGPKWSQRKDHCRSCKAVLSPVLRDWSLLTHCCRELESFHHPGPQHVFQKEKSA